MLKPMHNYFSHAPITRMDISQRGMLAVGYGRKVQVWQDALRSKAQAPYLTHHLPEGVLSTFRFVPYEDVLGIGHSAGISTILVPGECWRRRRAQGVLGGSGRNETRAGVAAARLQWTRAMAPECA